MRLPSYLPNTSFFHSDYSCFASGVVVVSGCGFGLGFLTDHDTKYLLMHLFAFPIVSVMYCLFKSFAHDFEIGFIQFILSLSYWLLSLSRASLPYNIHKGLFPGQDLSFHFLNDGF